MSTAGFEPGSFWSEGWCYYHCAKCFDVISVTNGFKHPTLNGNFQQLQKKISFDPWNCYETPDYCNNAQPSWERSARTVYELERENSRIHPDAGETQGGCRGDAGQTPQMSANRISRWSMLGEILGEILLGKILAQPLCCYGVRPVNTCRLQVLTGRTP